LTQNHKQIEHTSVFNDSPVGATEKVNLMPSHLLS